MKNNIQIDSSISPEVSIRPWNKDDLPLLRSMNTEEMWEHLGGPETEAAVVERHKRYLESVPGKTQMFVIMFRMHAAGYVGYWQRQWNDAVVFEVGWNVLPNYQGRGITTLATSALLSILYTEAPRAVVHAFPDTKNTASNAICRKLGFALIDETNFEFPPGTWMKCNDWCLTL